MQWWQVKCVITFGDRQRGAPLALQNVQANAAVVVHVAVVDACRELNLLVCNALID